MIDNPNQVTVRPKVTGNGVEIWGPNFWLRTGHCRRCENGLGHTSRRGAGGEKSTGLLLQRPGAHYYEDEMARGEKVKLRRQVRHREKAATRRHVNEEV